MAKSESNLTEVEKPQKELTYEKGEIDNIQMNKKRKNPDSQEKIKKKRSRDEDMERTEYSVGEVEDVSDDNETNELHEPSLQELRESEKPENQISVETVRQKKKQKHFERIEAQKDQNCDKEKQRNEEYLQKWKNSPEEWKFEKLRQVSIQQSVFDEEKINQKLWPIALEYLSGSKGGSKENIIKLAEGEIEALDAECALKENEEERKAIINSSKYQRARDIIQCFD